MNNIEQPKGKPSFSESLMIWLAPRRVPIAAAMIIAIIALSLWIYSSQSRGQLETAMNGIPPTPEIEDKPDGGPQKLLIKQAIASPKRHRVVPLPVKYFRRKADHLGTRPDNDIAQQPLPAVNPDEPINGNGAENGSREMLRIELQTADPNIRIIWFAPKQSSDMSKPLNETR